MISPAAAVKAMPTVIMVEMAVASAICFAMGDKKNGVYWGAAAVLNFSIIFM